MFLQPKTCWLLLCIFYAGFSHALPSDRQKQLDVKAAYSHADLKQHIITHKGNVVALQGTTQLTGDTVVIYLNEKNEFIKGIAFGKPATYRTLTDERKPEFYAEGNEIHYLIDKQLILLIGNAKVRQGENTYTGPRLEYLIEKEIVISPKSPEGRASLVIQPSTLSTGKTQP